jgi:protoporphyrinogen/coproporphyrinogen III oxidase
MTVRVAVVGGGLTGLFTATELVAAGVDDIVVLESSEQAGGVARTIVRDGFSLEPGVGSFTLPHPHLSSVLDRIGVQLEPAAATPRHVWTGRHLMTLPSSPTALASRLVSARAKLRGALEPIVSEPPGDDDEPLDRLLQRRFGHDLGRMLAWLAASGVYAGDPRRLSARTALPLLTQLLEAHGSIVRGALTRVRHRPSVRPAIHVPVGGMAALADGAAAALGDRFRRRHRVNAVRRSGERWIVDGPERIEADHVVLTCDPPTAAQLVEPGELADLLTRSVAAPVVVVGLGGVATSESLPAGFGILTGPDAGTYTRGVLLESSYAPQRAPAGHWLVKVIAGGAIRGGIVEADDADIVETVGDEVARIVGTDLAASFVEVVRHRPGIPQYEVGHGRWLGAVDAATPPGLHLAGWGYRGIGITALATAATHLPPTLTG